MKTLIFDTLLTEFKNFATTMLTTKKEFLDLKQMFESATIAKQSDSSELGATLQQKLDQQSQKLLELQTNQRVFSSENADLKNNLNRIQKTLEQQNLSLKQHKDQFQAANRVIEAATPIEVFESYKVEIWGKI